MQRRAAAAYVTFFLVVAAGAYGFMATAQAPQVTVENPDYTLTNNATFTVDDRQYRVTSLEAEESSGGGHGGGGGTSYSGEVQWINESASHTATWNQNATIRYRGTRYRVLIPNTSDPGEFTLREEPANDTELERRNGTTYVIVEEGDDTFRRVPIDDYEELDRRSFQEGEEIDYRGNTTTIENVTTARALLRWTSPAPETVELANSANVTLNGQRFVTHFHSGEEAYLSSDVDGYFTKVHKAELFHQRMSGVWGVMAISAVAVILLTAMAYLPRKE